MQRILLVEDDPKDVELTLTALEEYNLANEVLAAHDGAETFHYLYRRSNFASRTNDNTAVLPLDLKLPKVDRLEVQWISTSFCTSSRNLVCFGQSLMSRRREA
jgi:CheY-like chemotaxis protein